MGDVNRTFLGKWSRREMKEGRRVDGGEVAVVVKGLISLKRMDWERLGTDSVERKSAS